MHVQQGSAHETFDQGVNLRARSLTFACTDRETHVVVGAPLPAEGAGEKGGGGALWVQVCVAADRAGSLVSIEFCDGLETKGRAKRRPSCSFSLLHLVSMTMEVRRPCLREAHTPTPAIFVFSRLFPSVDARNGWYSVQASTPYHVSCRLGRVAGLIISPAVASNISFTKRAN